ncbi:MAG: dTMP kinase [Raoultibacter sp.]
MDCNDQNGTWPGIFITFEGGEGAGKTTHINFLAQVLRKSGREVLCLREPGGTPIGESLRRIVLDTKNDVLCDQAELFLYEAARAQIISEIVKPALARGAVILCDRFYDSTLAYQVYGRGLPESFVRQANTMACQGVHPCRTILLTTGASAEAGLQRATHHTAADRVEAAGADFHKRVNEGFLKIATESPERIRVVVSAAKKSQTARAVFEQLADVFDWEPGSAVFAQESFAELDIRKTEVAKASIQSEV